MTQIPLVIIDYHKVDSQFDVTKTHYFKEIDGINVLHCENSPAYTEKYRWHDALFLEKYYINGELHREDGPAIITRRITSSQVYLQSEIYFKNGKKHRTTGPAHTKWYEDSTMLGKIFSQQYFLNGEFATKKDMMVYHLNEILKPLGFKIKMSSSISRPSKLDSYSIYNGVNTTEEYLKNLKYEINGETYTDLVELEKSIYKLIDIN